MKLSNVWGNMPGTTKKEVLQFWLDENAIHDEQVAAERADQVVMVARDPQNSIAGICTAFEAYNEQLENYFYYYRTFVSAIHRRSNVARTLTTETRKFFESCFAQGINTKVIGMFVIVENELLKKYQNTGVWASSRLVYIGKNERGDHLRVYYFEGARINQDHLQ